jgi:hypothetical protein
MLSSGGGMAVLGFQVTEFSLDLLDATVSIDKVDATVESVLTV